MICKSRWDIELCPHSFFGRFGVWDTSKLGSWCFGWLNCWQIVIFISISISDVKFQNSQTLKLFTFKSCFIMWFLFNVEIPHDFYMFWNQLCFLIGWNFRSPLFLLRNRIPVCDGIIIIVEILLMTLNSCICFICWLEIEDDHHCRTMFN